ncbi:SAF domain-containing protein [Ruania alba]|uniref:SAF domain-containing protein n=1 Tax=Ruania alba TaxID=648782 RepID=A0A1H5MXG8_9MICO|nr:SAF domain-containing protein [Ruania alba]SEE94054.1 SAF domain-containing protein [Ruania alba]
MTTSPRLRGLLWRFRFVLAVACLTGAGLLLLGELRPGPDTVTVTVTARDLPAGTVLTSADLREEQVLATPEGAVAGGQLVGATLVAGLPAGMPIPETLLVGPGLIDAAPPGSVVLPVRLADPSLMALVRVGDRLDLYRAPSDAAGVAGESSRAELVAESALVLGRMGAEDAPTGLLTIETGDESGVVIVAVPRDGATVLSGASSLAPVRAVLVPGESL